eukprot:gene12960-biopygen1403
MPRSAAKPAERRRPCEAREPPWSATEYVECVDRLQRHGVRGAPRSAAERRGVRGAPRRSAARRGAPRSAAERRGAPRSAAEHAKYVAARMPREFELPCSCCQRCRQLPNN